VFAITVLNAHGCAVVVCNNITTAIAPSSRPRHNGTAAVASGAAPLLPASHRRRVNPQPQRQRTCGHRHTNP
jgi:hypothetical protein